MRRPKVRRHLAVVQERHGGDLEAACTNCGTCCFTQVELEAGLSVVLHSLPCRYLAWVGTGAERRSRCTVYERRHETARWCHRLVAMIQKSVLPAACPYADGLPGYQGPVTVGDPDYRRLEDLVRAAYRGAPCPEWCKPEDWEAFLSAEP